MTPFSLSKGFDYGIIMELKDTDVPGLYCINDFITPEEEKSLLRGIYQQPWKKNRSQTRNIQFYGPSHGDDYKVRKDSPVVPLPQCTAMLIQKIKQVALQLFPKDTYMSNLGNSQLTELFVNEYLPQDELRFHRDHTITYKDIIVGVSLGGDATFRFVKSLPKGKTKDFVVELPPRSIYFMTGESRKYKHGMRKGDIKDKRVSLTFRVVDEEKII